MSVLSVRRAVAAFAVAAAGAAAVPAGASAAAIATAKCPTYVPTINGGDRFVGVSGSGFKPAGSVGFKYSGKGGSAGTLPINASGIFSGGIFGPTDAGRGAHVHHYTLSASDGVNAATAAIKVVRLGVSPRQNGSPYKHVTRRIFGFPRHKKVWAHYAFKGKVRKRVYLGRAKGACGLAKKRMRSQPAHPRVGTWHVYYSNHKKFTKRDAAKKRFVIRTTFTESLVAGRRASAAAATPERVAYGRLAR